MNPNALLVLLMAEAAKRGDDELMDQLQDLDEAELEDLARRWE